MNNAYEYLHTTNYDNMDREFEFVTDEVIFRVIGSGVNIEVNSIHDARITVRSLVQEGVMCQTIVEKLVYVKRLYAMNQNGKFMFQYYKVWRRFPIENL